MCYGRCAELERQSSRIIGQKCQKLSQNTRPEAKHNQHPILGKAIETSDLSAQCDYMEKPIQSVTIARQPNLFPIRLRSWTVVVMAIALLVATPVLFILGNIFVDAGDVWKHLASTVLWRYITNSFWLMMGVGCGVLVIGVGTAWLVTMCRFPGSRLFEWALLLPLAAPAYVLAYSYTDFLEFSGPVQTALRNLFGWGYGDYWFPNVRSLWGAIAMLTLVLYPYVYLLARVAFLEQSVCTLEASRSLACSPWRSFTTVALPLARPAIMAGLLCCGFFNNSLFLQWKNFSTTLDSRFWGFARNSFTLAIVTAILGVAIALIMAYGLRLRSNAGMRFATRLASMGYAVPGSVIAVGILIPIGQVDNTIDAGMRSIFGVSTGLLFSGTITALVYAYLVRFLAVSLSTVEASLGKIKPTLDDAARSLGYSATETLVKVHTPIMRGGLLTAGTPR